MTTRNLMAAAVAIGVLARSTPVPAQVAALIKSPSTSISWRLYGDAPVPLAAVASRLTSASAQQLSLDYWNGKSPMFRVQGLTLFGVIARWGDNTAEPILDRVDNLPTTTWGLASKIELVETVPFLGSVHLGDGLYFTECRQRGCTLSDPDIAWVVGSEGLRFHLYMAQKLPDENRVEYCAYHVGVNGVLTGQGFGRWFCYKAERGSLSLPAGSPQSAANRIYRTFTAMAARRG
jgi:hypothetical protein